MIIHILAPKVAEEKDRKGSQFANWEKIPENPVFFQLRPLGDMCGAWDALLCASYHRTWQCYCCRWKDKHGPDLVEETLLKAFVAIFFWNYEGSKWNMEWKKLINDFKQSQYKSHSVLSIFLNNRPFRKCSSPFSEFGKNAAGFVIVRSYPTCCQATISIM